AFLLKTYDRIVASLDDLRIEQVPIHGDAGLHNVFITPDGARWTDFEDVSIGPREWDVGCLPGADLTAFEPINRDALSVLGYLRSLGDSVWCWAKYDRPEKREAADYHLGYLKEQFL